MFNNYIKLPWLKDVVILLSFLYSAFRQIVKGRANEEFYFGISLENDETKEIMSFAIFCTNFVIDYCGFILGKLLAMLFSTRFDNNLFKTQKS